MQQAKSGSKKRFLFLLCASAFLVSRCAKIDSELATPNNPFFRDLWLRAMMTCQDLRFAAAEATHHVTRCKAAEQKNGRGSKNRYQNGILVGGNMGKSLRFAPPV